MVVAEERLIVWLVEVLADQEIFCWFAFFVARLILENLANSNSFQPRVHLRVFGALRDQGLYLIKYRLLLAEIDSCRLLEWEFLVSFVHEVAEVLFHSHFLLFWDCSSCTLPRENAGPLDLVLAEPKGQIFIVVCFAEGVSNRNYLVLSQKVVAAQLELQILFPPISSCLEHRLDIRS